MGVRLGHQERKDYLMDYAAALIVYFASLFGVVTSISGMISFRNDKAMVRFMTLTCLVFCGTLYLGGLMVKAVS